MHRIVWTVRITTNLGARQEKAVAEARQGGRCDEAPLKPLLWYSGISATGLAFRCYGQGYLPTEQRSVCYTPKGCTMQVSSLKRILRVTAHD